MEINDCYKQMLSVLMYLDENDDGVGIALGYQADEMVKNAIKNATQANGVTMENGECHIQRVSKSALLDEWNAGYNRGCEDTHAAYKDNI